jgi:hypothetical protein
MKKAILGISVILVGAFTVIMFANAQNNPQAVKKSASETSAACPKAPSNAVCPMMSAGKTAEVKGCDPAKCKAMGCDPAKCKEGKCDPATCKSKMTGAAGEMKKCDPAMCPMAAKK